MKIILCDKNKTVIDACKHLESENIKVVHGDIFEQEFDAVATPSNSFGFMDGNFDYLVIQKYGIQIQKNIEDYIIEGNELLVGQVFVNPPTESGVTVIVAPTMRVPVSITGTVNSYLAMKSAFKAAKKEGVKTIAIPGFGTGCGGLSPDVFAMQFEYAANLYNQNTSQHATWKDAQFAHYKLANGIG